MARTEDRGPTDTGVLVYPKLKVPSAHRHNSEPRGPSKGGKTLYVLFLFLALAGGGAGGFMVRPLVWPEERIAQLETAVAEMQAAASSQKARADALDKDLATISAEKVAADKRLDEAQQVKSELAGTMGNPETRAKAAATMQLKLKAVIDKGAGSVSIEGDEIHVQIADRGLFKPADDQLTDRGRQVFAKIAVAFNDLPDHQVWVHGHTDDQPIVIPAIPKKSKNSPAVPAPSPRFATNWELSAARALEVVHYLQDTAKFDPTRLAALAFGQYRPVSRGNKAANRRIEIVLVPKRVAPAK